MIFFTDVQTKASNYSLINIKRYDDPRKATKKICFIDPDVMVLRKQTEYPMIEKLHWLAQGHLQPNEYLSIDYPCDMNPPMQEEFLRKSIENNWKYQDNPQYICTIQFKWYDPVDFEFRLKELEPIWANKKKIVGIGNMCRFFIQRSERVEYSPANVCMKQCIATILKHKDKFYWIHFYGLALYAIKRYLSIIQYTAPKIILSVDNTKWTFGADKTRSKYMKHPNQQQLIPTNYPMQGYCCSSFNRDEFFLDYMDRIEHAGLKVSY